MSPAGGSLVAPGLLERHSTLRSRVQIPPPAWHYYFQPPKGVWLVV